MNAKTMQKRPKSTAIQLQYPRMPYSRGIKVEKMLTLAPERYTARFVRLQR